MLKLDYSLESPQERKKLVEKILEENPNPPEKYLEILADYLVLCMEKQERKEKKLLTENRLATVNKREISYEGLVSQLENGEDSIYNLINNDKQQFLNPRIKITKEDIAEIPFLKQVREAIAYWEKLLPKVSGKSAYTIKRTIIELRKDQYIIKNAFRRPIVPNSLGHSRISISLEGEHTFDKNGRVIATGISLINPKVVSTILCNYSSLKQDCWGEFEKDLWLLMYDFDIICAKAMEKYPIYERIIQYKIDALSNAEIQQKIKEEFNAAYGLEYISALWRNKIPKMIASAAEDQYLYWYYYFIEKGHYKRCNKCGKIKLANNKYYSRNGTSKDGYYSICKECRSTKKKRRYYK